MRLHINIDHVATLRNARGTPYPDPVLAARACLEAGANVCIGSDATAPDRSGDMFRHMQQCMHYHRTFFKDPTWLPPGRVLEMCTVDAAKALGMDRDIGFANGNDVHTVIVDGRIALQGRKALFVDEDEILDDAQRETDAMLDRTGFRFMLDTPKTFWKHVRATDQIAH